MDNYKSILLILLIKSCPYYYVGLDLLSYFMRLVFSWPRTYVNTFIWVFSQAALNGTVSCKHIKMAGGYTNLS